MRRLVTVVMVLDSTHWGGSVSPQARHTHTHYPLTDKGVRVQNKARTPFYLRGYAETDQNKTEVLT